MTPDVPTTMSKQLAGSTPRRDGRSPSEEMKQAVQSPSLPQVPVWDVKPPSLASASPTCSIPPSQPRPLSWGSPATFSAAAVAETAGISAAAAAVVAAGGGPGSGLTEENLRSRERTRSPPASNGSNSNLIRNTLTRPDWDLTAAGSRQL